MFIALDYDNTFTNDPIAWNDALSIMKQSGHSIIGVTMRHPDQHKDLHPLYLSLCDQITFTSSKFKRKHMQDRGFKVDVWIDDMPEMICEPVTIIGHPVGFQ